MLVSVCAVCRHCATRKDEISGLKTVTEGGDKVQWSSHSFNAVKNALYLKLIDIDTSVIVKIDPAHCGLITYQI